MTIFGELERLAADLYPYRWLITIGFAIATLVVLGYAYTRAWHLVVWRYKIISAIVAAVFLAVAIPAGDYFLSPLWERSRLEETSPLAVAAGASETTAEGRVTHRGVVTGADDFHFGEGTALLIETSPGQYTLRFEEFSVLNGPDLFVYLTPAKESVDGAINLGDLKATDGAFNYDVPEGTDVSQFTYAIVWCRQFGVLFASAPLDAVDV